MLTRMDGMPRLFLKNRKDLLQLVNEMGQQGFALWELRDAFGKNRESMAIGGTSIKAYLNALAEMDVLERHGGTYYLAGKY